MTDSKSRWGDIFTHLKNKGFNVYSPDQHKGECIEPYVVVKDAGLSGLVAVSSSQKLYDLMCYVPLNKYSDLEPYVDSVETAMDELYPVFRPVHYRTPSFLDDTVKAHMISTQYVNYRKNIRR